MALQEYHVVPEVEDHALKRSVFFGFSWHYTQFLKQIFLLVSSIGIKRVHLLTILAPLQTIDQDTYNLLIWGISFTLLAVILIRSYSFGFGRHPSKYDPASLWRIKVAWWTALCLLCLSPPLVGITIIQNFPTPLVCLISLGGMMFIIILFEAYASNKAAELTKSFLIQNNSEIENIDEMTYLRQSNPGSFRKQLKGEGGNSTLADASMSFLHCREPKHKSNILE